MSRRHEWPISCWSANEFDDQTLQMRHSDRVEGARGMQPPRRTLWIVVRNDE